MAGIGRAAWALAGAGAFIVGSLGLGSAMPDVTAGVFSGSPPTPYLRFEPEADPVATALLVHGLNSSKEFMQTIGMALADAGIDAYAIDLPGHGDSKAAFDSDETRRAVEIVLDSFRVTPIVVGHSMGASILADIAPTRRFHSMVLLSPAPIPVGDLGRGRLLVVTGALDPPVINEFIPELLGGAQGSSEWWVFPAVGHSGTLFSPTRLAMVADWMGGSAGDLRTSTRFGWLALMAAGGVLAGLGLLARPRVGPAPASEPPTAPDLGRTLVSYVAAGGAAIIILRFVVPLRWLGLFTTDYLMSFVLLAGLACWRGRGIPSSVRGVMIGIVGAAYTIGVLALGVGSHVFHMLPSGEQWARFPILAAVSLPLFLADELDLRRIAPAWKRAVMVTLTRMILWAAVLTGVLLLNTESMFLVLITHLAVVFWLVLWWLAGFIRNATGDPVGTALFSALVQGWVFATLFVTI